MAAINMTIGRRLGLMVVAPILIAAGLGGVNIYQLHSIDTKTRFAAKVQVESLALLGDVARRVNEMRVSLRDQLLSEDASERAKAGGNLTANAEELTKLLARYGDHL